MTLNCAEEISFTVYSYKCIVRSKTFQFCQVNIGKFHSSYIASKFRIGIFLNKTKLFRRPFSRSSSKTGGAGVGVGGSRDTSRPPSAFENNIDYFREPVVKSPPEPTRVKSPEGIIRSPDPINWTVPLDTAKTFSVTQSVRDGGNVDLVILKEKKSLNIYNIHCRWSILYDLCFLFIYLQANH